LIVGHPQPGPPAADIVEQLFVVFPSHILEHKGGAFREVIDRFLVVCAANAHRGIIRGCVYERGQGLFFAVHVSLDQCVDKDGQIGKPFSDVRNDCFQSSMHLLLIQLSRFKFDMALLDAPDQFREFRDPFVLSLLASRGQIRKLLMPFLNPFESFFR
jgi:hypothetical protein